MTFWAEKQALPKGHQLIVVLPILTSLCVVCDGGYVVAKVILTNLGTNLLEIGEKSTHLQNLKALQEFLSVILEKLKAFNYS